VRLHVSSWTFVKTEPKRLYHYSEYRTRYIGCAHVNPLHMDDLFSLFLHIAATLGL